MTSEDASKVSELVATAPDPDEDDLDDLDGISSATIMPAESTC